MDDPFRGCDVRGTYPDQVNEALFFHLGQAIASELLEDGRIIVGHDARPSSFTLKRALTDGLIHGSAHVLDAGMVPTPVVSWGCRQLNLDAAIITASHNPVSQNGLKLILRKGPTTGQDLMRLRNWGGSGGQELGSIERVDLSGPYVDGLAAQWDPGRSGPRSRPFVLDPGNGAWSTLAPQLFQRLGLDASTIHGTLHPDVYPSRGFDCAKPGALLTLGATVRQEIAAAGIAWDGDGDRVAVCDEHGQPLSTDQLALLLLPRLIPAGRSEKVLLDVKMSSRVHEAVQALGATPVLEQSAHCRLKARMNAENCIAGFEYSGHIFLRELGGYDDGMYAALLFAKCVHESDDSVSAMVRRLPPVFITPDIRITAAADAFASLEQRVLDLFSANQICRLDGVKVQLKEGWFLIRPSVSESKICFRFEANSQTELDNIISKVASLLPDQSPTLLSTVAHGGLA